jgi:hypothetical protein
MLPIVHPKRRRGTLHALKSALECHNIVVRRGAPGKRFIAHCIPLCCFRLRIVQRVEEKDPTVYSSPRDVGSHGRKTVAIRVGSTLRRQFVNRRLCDSWRWSALTHLLSSPSRFVSGSRKPAQDHEETRKLSSGWRCKRKRNGSKALLRGRYLCTPQKL